jgi:hypothetical protein
MIRKRTSSGTGKTSAVDVLRHWCYNPRIISGKSISIAALRDELNNAKLGTALIEEADEASEPVECEQLYSAWFNRTTGKMIVKEKKPIGESWDQVEKEQLRKSCLTNCEYVYILFSNYKLN